MPGGIYTNAQALTLLAATPARIAALTEELTPAQLRTRPSPDEWSANDVLAHLRACADIWGGCMVKIITEDTPTLHGMDPRRWMKQTDYPELDFRPSLRAYTDQRAGLLARLESLPHEGWLRTATVMAWGQAYQRTALDYARRLTDHERAHIRQVERIVSALRG